MAKGTYISENLTQFQIDLMLLLELTQTYNPLDSLGASVGNYHAEWKLNITEMEIMDIVNKQY